MYAGIPGFTQRPRSDVIASFIKLGRSLIAFTKLADNFTTNKILLNHVASDRSSVAEIALLDRHAELVTLPCISNVARKDVVLFDKTLKIAVVAI